MKNVNSVLVVIGLLLLIAASPGFILTTQHQRTEAEVMAALYNYSKLQQVALHNTVPENSGTAAKQSLLESLTSFPEDSTSQKIAVPALGDSAREAVEHLDSLAAASPKAIDTLKDSAKTGIFPLKKDSTKAMPKVKLSKKDSLRILDSLQLETMKKDSTARMAHMKYKRKDSPVLSFTNRKQSRLFTEPTQKSRSYKIDSTGQYVTIEEKVGSQLLKYPIRIPIDQFLAMKIKSKEQEAWDELGYKYELKSGKKDLSNLLKDITDFEIPLPSVGVLSIFGAPKISLRINGSVDIHGAWRSETTEGVTASRLGNTRNEPDFRQQVQVNVNGTIGDKLQIQADWNTERTFEYENQLKIKYTGYEDEIVQSVEAGNVSLQGASLVGSSDALFGIKAAMKLGPLSLTAIASQKKGEVKEKTLSGGSSSSEFTKRAYDYSKTHFFLDQVYADTSEALNIFNNYYGNPTPLENLSVRVKDIEVWKSTTQSTNDPQERLANVYINLQPRFANGRLPDSLRGDITTIQGKKYSGRFLKLTNGQDYILHAETGFISFKSNIQDQDVIAVAYQVENTNTGTADDLFYGEFLRQNDSTSTGSKLVLKMVKPQNLQPTDREAWNLMLKNIYPLGPRNIKKDGFELDIKYETPGEPVSILGSAKLLSAFGLDLTNSDGSSNTPDGVFDFNARTIIPETGELIFPKLQPFGNSIPKSLPDADSLKYSQIYENTTILAQQDKSKDKFIITGKSTGEANSTYQLGFNIVENSVKVILNGRELTSGIDYTVDYTMGSLSIRNEAALVPGANLRITYEENDLFQLASKTLFGLRGMIDFSKNTKLGFTLLTLSQQTLSDKVRIGEEPLSNTIYGLDFSTTHDLPFVTKFLDKIYSTREPSSLTFRGELAMMNPDPNTKKSTVTSDDGESIAYIDDFEGSKRIIPVGISYTQWKDSAPPVEKDSSSQQFIVSRMARKGKSFWYNILPSITQVTDIWPEKKVAQGEEAVTVLDFVYNPLKSGTYNYGYSNANDSRRNWGGMVRQLSSSANDLISDNIEFIEFWGKIDHAPADAVLNIDLGRVSEDIIPNGKLDKEDKNNNELIDEGEDNGLDGLSDAEELSSNPSKTGPDPAGDNFSFTSARSTDPANYEAINGLQGNAALTDAGRFPDTEDLNRNYTLDNVNSYFRYSVPLVTDATKNAFIAGGGAKGWYLFRIPLKAFSAQIGEPTLTSVEAIRLFFTGVNDTVHIKLAEFNLVGNQWQRLSKADSTILNISVVNVEDNPDYVKPSGVERERDRSRPDQNILKNEQSLNLSITNLKHGQSTQAVKYLGRPLDLFNYSQMKIFIHTSPKQGPNSLAYYVDANNYTGEVFFRFGNDTSNYYEYRQPIRENPLDNNWDEMKVVFSELTALKQARDSANMIYRVAVPGRDGHYYVVKGSPALTQIKFLSVGVTHKTNEDPVLQQDISGDIWVNELRVIGADDTKGWAYTGSVSVKLADLINLSYNYSRTDPYFHRLAERFGSRTESISWGVAADMEFVKFLPFDSQESQLKVNYSHNESVGKPLYLPGTDVKVDEAAALQKQKLINAGYSEEYASSISNAIVTQSQTLNTSDSWALPSIKLKIPTNHWLVRDTWNSLSFGFNYNRASGRNPSVSRQQNWQWNANMSYNLNLSQDNYLDFGTVPLISTVLGFLPDYKGYRIYYTPQNFTYSISARRSRQMTNYRGTTTSQARTDVSRDFGATRGASLNWKLTENGLLNLAMTYSFDYTSTLAYLEIDENKFQRSNSAIFNQIFSGVFFGRDLSYNQSFDLRSSPKLPSFWDIGKNFALTAGYSARYQWTNDPLQPDLGRSVGVGNRSSLGLTIRWKTMFEQILPPAPTTTQAQGVRGGVPPALQPNGQDSSAVVDTSKGLKKYLTVANALLVLRSFAHTVFVDYDNIRVNFSNDNTYASSGILGTGSGFKNFFGLSYNQKEGPSRLYMLGLSSAVGPRARNANITDNVSQRNNLDMSTSKPLWEGARVDLTWKVSWSENKSTGFLTDSLGNTKITSVTRSGSLTRSFFSMPPWSVFSVFKSGLKRVNELYTTSHKNLNDAFVEGFESFSWFNRVGFFKDIGRLVPRPNWRISWDGLEKFFPFKNYTKRVSLDHSYASDYNEGYRFDQNGRKELTSQRITYGFQPLVGLNLTFNDLWSGNFGGNVKYSTRTSYDLSATNKNISEDFSKDIGLTLSYTKNGFEIPLFGLSLKNDFEFSFSYTYTKNSTVLYNMAEFDEKGVPQNGTIRTSLEPRVKYVMSSRVTLSIFYKRSSTKPEGAARIPPTTTNEAGLDVRISIQ